ncbi:MAG: Wzz/FepE/Etk N-terminal domain-containing protein [Pseudomonadota bacterium]
MSASRTSSRRDDERPAQAVGYRMSAADLVVRLWRAKWLMLLVFLPIAVAGVFLATLLPTKYTASSRLFVALGDEYIFRPVVGDQIIGGTPQLEELIQAELELLRSPVVAERAIERFPIRRVYPAIAKARDEALADAKPGERDDILAEHFALAVDALQRDFGVGAAPKTPVIATYLSNEDAEVSAEVLNAIVGAYLNYRSDIFADRSSSTIRDERDRYTEELLAAEEAMRGFLAENEIGDYETERQTVQILFQTLSAELLQAESRFSAVQGQLASVRSQLAEADPQVELFAEDQSQQPLVALELEREDLLSRYTPESRPVQAIEKRIEQARAFLESRDAPSGTVRRGPNPLYQELESTAGTLAGTAAFEARQVAALRRQLADVSERQRRLANLRPEWLALERQRDVLEINVRQFAERELQARSRTEIARTSSNNIRVLEPARTPIEGSSLKLPVAMAAGLFAGFSALIAGLLQAFTRQGMPTRQSFERATGLPVVAEIPPLRAS